MAERAYDAISLGEVMLRMSPPRYQRLRQARTLDIHVAGAQLNVAANLARFGRQTAFLTRLPDSELGQLARDACMAYGVDMQHALLTPNARMGLNFLEFSTEPRAPVALFDRQHSAASQMQVADFDWAALAASTHMVHTDGIVPGLSADCHACAYHWLSEGRLAGAVTAFDVNYREHLWTPQTARACWDMLLPLVDVVVTSRGVSETVFGWTDDDETLARRYHETFGCRWVAVTTREHEGVLRGAWNSLLLADGTIYTGRRYAFDIVDRYGTGDVFFAGLMQGFLQGDAAFAVAFANAACALAHTTEGDVAAFSAADVLPLLNETFDLRVKR